MPEIASPGPPKILAGPQPGPGARKIYELTYGEVDLGPEPHNLY